MGENRVHPRAAERPVSALLGADTSALITNAEWLSLVFGYLEDLRESGIVNMYAAGPFIQSHFLVGPHVAGEALARWLDTFSAEARAAMAAARAVWS